MAKNPLVTGLAIGAAMPLIQGLFTSSGYNSSASYNPYATNVCTTQYYYTTNPGTGDPCAIYSPNGGAGTTLPSTPAADNNISDLLNQLGQNSSTTLNQSTQSCPSLPIVICAQGQVEASGGSDANGCPMANTCVDATSLSTSSSGGSALVTSSGTPCGSGSCSDGYFCSTVDPGQCIPNGQVDCGTYSCVSGDSCGANQQCVSPSSSSDAQQPSLADVLNNQNNYDNTTSPSTPAASQTPLNQNPIPVPPNGVFGGIATWGTGAAIYGQNRTSNTEVSGFFGGSGVGALCQSRPWASNFLSYIIPPSFFDNLCSLGGYPVGSSGLPQSSGGGQNTTTVVGPGTPATGAATTTDALAPQARIAASPGTVNIGGRTTVYWTSLNVASCQESSTDGNMHGTSTSGGDSTEPLSGPVTYTITCLGLDGQTVSDSFTVSIGI